MPCRSTTAKEWEYFKYDSGNCIDGWLAGTSLGDFLCIPTPNTGQWNPLFHTVGEFRLIVNRIVVRQSTDWLAANAQLLNNSMNWASCSQLFSKSGKWAQNLPVSPYPERIRLQNFGHLKSMTCSTGLSFTQLEDTLYLPPMGNATLTIHVSR